MNLLKKTTQSVAFVLLSASLMLACSAANETNPDGTDPATNAILTAPVQADADVALAKTSKYRVVFIWAQMDDDGPDPLPEIAVDMPLDTNAKLVVPGNYAPPSEMNYLCKRSCDDEAKCGCTVDTPVKMAFAIGVIVEEGTNVRANLGNSKELRDMIVGYTDVALVWSNDAVPAGTVPFFEGAVEKGAKAYRIVPGTGAFDKLRLFEAGGTISIRKEGPNLT